MHSLRPLQLQRVKSNNPLKTRRVKHILKKLTPMLIVVGLLMLLSFFIISRSGTSYVSNILSGTSLHSTGDRVNILLLGITGGTHDGAMLTDTIMVASYNLKTNQVYLFSIPRDLWLPSFKSKANAVYEIGLSQNNGLGLAKTVMGNILGIPIHYAFRIDIKGFADAVDSLGGVDIIVNKSFDDYNFPIDGKEDDLCGYQEKELDISEDQAKQLNLTPGKQKVFVAPDGSIATNSAKEDFGAKYFTCRYEHISFTKGVIHMDGTTALKFVRSRHGTNGEGSDFARSKRQEAVLNAVRGKILSLETLSNPNKISQLINAFGRSVDTDIAIKDVLEFYKLSRKLEKIHNFVLDDSSHVGLPNGLTALLVNPPSSDYGGAYVLISQDDDFSIVQGYVRKILTGELTDEEATAAARPRN